jgi:hypothetical protein
MLQADQNQKAANWIIWIIWMIILGGCKKI